MSMKLKRGQKEKIESALSDAMAQLEIEDAQSDDLKKKELALKRVVTKVNPTIAICAMRHALRIFANPAAGDVNSLGQFPGMSFHSCVR